MAKQIYIDSNGNEIPVSGTITNDNNLPHFSGTPTAGTTAYEIASKLDKSLVKTKEINGTTNASGAIELGLNYPSCVLLSTILASSDASMYCVPMAYSTSPNKIYVYVKRYDNTSVANTNVKVICSYIDMTPNMVT